MPIIMVGDLPSLARPIAYTMAVCNAKSQSHFRVQTSFRILVTSKIIYLADNSTDLTEFFCVVSVVLSHFGFLVKNMIGEVNLTAATRPNQRLKTRHETCSEYF